MYLPDKGDFVDCKLIHVFIMWYINKTSPTTSHVSKALIILQCKLSDAMNALGESPRKGSISKDTWIKQFTRDKLVKVCSNKEAQHRDLHADMDCQISYSD
jgi:hypothetical protein